MKALPMLDHVMLWVARMFAIFALIWSVSQIIESLSWRYWISQFVVADFLASVFWVAASWCLSKDAGRLYLGLSGTFMSAMYFFHMLIYPHISTTWPLLGFIAIAWTGFRAPEFPRLKLTPTHKGKISDSPTSISGNLFRGCSAGLVIP